MICPKCEFSQPDDIYCANCGVNVDKYVKKRKKKRYQAGIIITVMSVAVLSIAVFTTTEDDSEEFEISRKDQLSKDRVEAKRTRSERPRGPNLDTELARRPVSKSRKEALRPAKPEDRRSRRGETSARSSPEEAIQKTEPDKSVLAARELFEKGVSLDDDSDNEIEFYQKAIEQDPQFAPPYYRLGAIYFRQADYNLAEQNFVLFLQNASDEDRQTYDINFYFSLEDLEELLEEEKTEPAPQEGEEQTATEPEEAAIAEAGVEAATEETEEVESIIKFAAANGNMVVPVILNGTTNASLLFDTGADITVLSSELAQSLDLVAEAGREIRLKTVAADVQAQVATLDSITVGDLSRTDFRVAVVELNLDENRRFEGILGMDFLGNYSIRIDNAANRILLAPR